MTTTPSVRILWRYQPEILLAFRVGLLALAAGALVILARVAVGGGAVEPLVDPIPSLLAWVESALFGVVLMVFGSAAGRSTRDRLIGPIVLVSCALTFVAVAAIAGVELITWIAGGVLSAALAAYWLRFVQFSTRGSGVAGLSAAQLALAASLLALLLGWAVAIAAAALTASPLGVAPAALGYMSLAAAALSERRLADGLGDRTRSSDAVVALLFISGLLATAALATAVVPLFLLASVLQAAGVAILAVRLRRGVIRGGRSRAHGERHVAAAVVWLAAGAILLVAHAWRLVTGGTGGPSDRIGDAFWWTLLVGVLSSLLIGAMRDEELERSRRWPWCDDVVFWGLEAGLLALVAATLGDRPAVGSVAVAVVGLSALLAFAVHEVRLASSIPSPVVRTSQS
ncbi:MAG: hypothetical protein KGJ98_00705 [Chloroflexota bacterium]|nr:hypothetical protein [Chloroflexota bacterium]